MTTNTKSTRHSRSGRHISLPTRYRTPTPTYSPHHHLSPLRTSTFPSSLTHDINTDSIHHCDSESLLSLSDSPLTSSSHSDRHPEPKCVVCHLSSGRKSGLSCIKCHNYFHLSCIKPRIPLNAARMLMSWHCSDCLFGTVSSSGEPSITGATFSEPVSDPIGVLSSAVYTRQTNRVFLMISKSCRIQAASALSDTINNAPLSQTPLSWTKLFFFAIEVFCIPTQSGYDHRTSKTAQKIHDNLRRHLLTSSTDILFFSVNLTALGKKDGGIHPIAVGNILRRLTSKVANRFASHKVANFLRLFQLGVSVRNACEAAVHSARIITKSPNFILAKLDIKNTFNSIRQDILLRKCLINCPEIFRLASLAYGSPTPLMANGNLIWSNSGVQQGDPLGPLLFSLAIHEIASSMKSNFNIWYLDDAMIAGDPRSLCDDIKKCSCMLADIGLILNPSKSELVNQGLDESAFLHETQCIKSILVNVNFVKKEDVILLGSPLTSTAIRPQFQHKLSIFKAMTEKLSLLDRHPAYFLLKNCFLIPKLMYLLHSSPTFQHPDLLADFDDCLKSCATDICNVSFDDIGWIQATSPLEWAA